MKAFVTGGNGQLGYALVQRLQKEGYELTCFVHTLENQDTTLLKSLGVKRIVKGDLRTKDYKDFVEEGCTIFHGYSLSPGANQSQQVYDVHNLQVSKNLLEIAKEKNVKQFIYLGTCSVIGPKATKHKYLHEDDQVGPDEAYGKSKLAVEREIKKFYNETKIPSLILRIFPIYGPNAHINASPIRFCKLLQKKYFFVLGSGKNHYEFCFTRNAVEGVMLAHTQLQEGFHTYHVSESQKSAYIDIVKEIASHVNPEIKFIHIPVPFARLAGYTGDVLEKIFNKRFIFRTRSVKGLLGGWNTNVDKLVALGYEQPHTMQEGINEFVTWAKDNEMLEKQWEKPKSYL